jgi:hypothetical protein
MGLTATEAIAAAGSYQLLVVDQFSLEINSIHHFAFL